MKKLLPLLAFILLGSGPCNEAELLAQKEEYINTRAQLENALENKEYRKACALRAKVVAIRNNLCDMAGSDAPPSCSDSIPEPPTICIDSEI